MVNIAMDQHLYIPFLGGWTSINPSYFDVHQGVLTHPHIAMSNIRFLNHNYDSNVPLKWPSEARRVRCVVGKCPVFAAEESIDWPPLFFFVGEIWWIFQFPRKIEVWIAGELWMCKSRKDQQPSLDSQMIQWCHNDKWQQQQRPGGFVVKQSTRPGKLTVCYWKLPFSSLIYPVKMVIFHSYVNVYQRVYLGLPIKNW